MAIAVMMSTYNGEKYVAEQIDSILRQDLSGAAFRLYVRDDCSSDRTPHILSDYAAKHAGIILLDADHPQNLGVQGSFLRLLAYACADPENEYFAFADQDDVWMEEKLSKALRKIQAEPPAEHGRLYFSNKIFTDSQLNVLFREQIEISGNILDALWTSHASGCTMCFDRTLAEICLQKEPGQYFWHDNWIWHISRLIDSKVIFDNESYIYYRQHGDNAYGMAGVGYNYGGPLRFLRRAFSIVIKPNDHIKQKQIADIEEKYQALIPEENRYYIDAYLRYRTSLAAQRVLIFSPFVKNWGHKRRLIWRGMILFHRL